MVVAHYAKLKSGIIVLNNHQYVALYVETGI